MKKILFVCTGNTCRSAMANAIFNKTASEKNIGYCSDSCGLYADEGRFAEPNAITALLETGIDITKHRAKQATTGLLESADLIWVMTDSHRMTLVSSMPQLASKIAVMDIDDPYGSPLEVYRKCRDKIISRIDGFFERPTV